MQIDRKVLIIYASALGIAALTAVLITVIVVGGRSEPPSVENPVPEISMTGIFTPQLADFPIPDDLVVQKQPDWYPLRGPVEAWPNELAKQYWIPVEDIVLDHVKDDNKKALDSLLDSIP